MIKVLAIILARGGSTRIPRKNLEVLGFAPLVAHAAFRATEAKLVTRTVISTDDAEIAACVEPLNVAWVKRPPELSGPEARIEDAVAHALQTCEAADGVRYDYVVSLQAAVPIRPPGAIDALVSEVRGRNARGGVTVVRRSSWIWSVEGDHADTWWNPKAYPRSQDVQRGTFEEINSIQVTPRAEALARVRVTSPLVLMELPRWADHDIDTQADLNEARADWESIYSRDCAVHYPMHFVSHPDLRKIRAPLDSNMGESRIGVVLGNGPQIDALAPAFWRTLEGPKYLSIGVNRICCAEACVRHGFAPDLHLIWDAPAHGSFQTEAQKRGVERLAGRTWRLVSGEHEARAYEHDQVLALDDRTKGPAHSVRMWNVSADAALNVLYRLGVRQFYVYGVEMNGGEHCAVVDGPEPVKPTAWDSDDEMRSCLKFWRDVVREHGDAKIYCGAKHSRLVTEGVLEFGEVAP